MFKSFFKKTIVTIITFEAKAVLKKYKPKIVGITGSVGKTTTKDAIYKVLKTQYFVRKSEKSFNSEIGVPLTVLGFSNGWSNPFIWLSNIVRGLVLIALPMDYPEWLVIEVGADRPDDIKNLTKWLKPNIVVVTRFGDMPVHVEFFRTKARLVEEKSYLVKALKDGGTLIVNGDDIDALSFQAMTKNKTIVASFNKEGDVIASNNYISYKKNDKDEDVPIGISFKVNFSGNSIPINLGGVVGIQHVYPILLAIATGISLNMNILSVCSVLSEDIETPGRMRLLQGIKNSTIIDDSYNSSPIALEEALRTLAEIKTTKKKIVVLGDMMELGVYSKEAHVQAGKLVAKISDILVTVGVRARDIAKGAMEDGMSEKNIYQFDDYNDASRSMDELVGDGDIVLVKGSQSTRMEKIVEEIMDDPEYKYELLVRQDKEWQRR